MMAKVKTINICTDFLGNVYYICGDGLTDWQTWQDDGHSQLPLPKVNLPKYVCDAG